MWYCQVKRARREVSPAMRGARKMGVDQWLFGERDEFWKGKTMRVVVAILGEGVSLRDAWVCWRVKLTGGRSLENLLLSTFAE